MFESEHYLAIDKQRGWLVPSLTAAVTSFLRYRANGAAPFLVLHQSVPAACSGIVLYAISEEGDRRLRAALPGVVHVWHAVCHGDGDAAADEGEWVHFLRKQRARGREVLASVRAGGKKAITRYRVVDRLDGRVHLELEPVAGPSQHVRAQLALAGCPIRGDRIYGDASADAELLLHARRLSFVDPADGVTLTIESPLPLEFTASAGGEDVLRYVLFYKPYGVASQFTAVNPGDRCLADYALPAGVYPVGRLDKDSEGLLLLTNDGRANARLSDPKFGKEKAYWVQVERIPTDDALARLAAGVVIRGHTTRPCQVRRLEPPPVLPERDPPVRFRRDIPTCWLEIVLTEGKNRQVRRMTAAVGHPTLRLVRPRIDRFSLGALRPGEFAEVDSF